MFFHRFIRNLGRNIAIGWVGLLVCTGTDRNLAISAVDDERLVREQIAAHWRSFDSLECRSIERIENQAEKDNSITTIGFSWKMDGRSSLSWTRKKGAETTSLDIRENGSRRTTIEYFKTQPKAINRIMIDRPLNSPAHYGGLAFPGLKFLLPGGRTLAAVMESGGSLTNTGTSRNPRWKLTAKLDGDEYECILDEAHQFLPREITITAMNISLSVLLCPSDPAPSGQAGCQGTSYRANYGTEPAYGSNLHLSGPFTYAKPTSAADVTDGLSQTAAYSEKPRGNALRLVYDRFVDPLVDPVQTDPPPTVWFEYCDRQPIVPENFRTTTGINWLVGGLTQTCYNHMEVPNGPVPDCVMTHHFPGIARSSARSYHAAGANVALADGSVRFVTATIHRKTWRALGTRAGAEVIPNDW